ncbi:MAG: hypothetical protein AAFN74_06685 [Myxococcota bacterium]
MFEFRHGQSGRAFGAFLSGPALLCAALIALPTAAHGTEIGGICAGIRGNGPRIWAHFSSLARITEAYGPIRAAAGGSSGSISVFLFESVRANKLLRQCGGKACGRRERAAREALLFKSLEGLQQAGLTADITTILGLIEAVQAGGLEALLQDPTTAPAGVAALVDILTDPAVQRLINPELLTLLQQSPDPAFHAQDIVDSLSAAASFSVSDPNVFVRPGVINFAAIVDLFGRLGSFLAAYGAVDREGLKDFFESCATPGRGLEWPEVAALPASTGTCGSLFSGLFESYVDALDESSPSRLDDKIGRFAPALVTTSVLQGDAVDTFQAAKLRYFAAQPVTELGVDFDDVRFGYWGRRRDLRRAEALLPLFYPDAKSDRFSSLGRTTWRAILQLSPAEPGLSRALELPDGRVSAGGWTDPVPSQVLRAIGCRRVILVNRRDGIGSFTTGVAGLLGASEDDLDALYDLADPQSGFTSALRAAAGVWCTDWDAPDTLDIRGLSAQGFSPPLETADRRLLRRYSGAGTNLGIGGCTPGVVP